MDFTTPVKELRSIVAIIDCQGFISNKKFIPRECAIITDGYATKFDVKNDLSKELMSSKDLTTNIYNQKFIHGMEFNPSNDKYIRIEDFEIFLKDIYGLLKKNNDSSFGVKNSQLKKILDDIGIPTIDLDKEHFNIPSMDNIDIIIPERFTKCESHEKLSFSRCQRKYYCSLIKVKTLKQIVESRLRALIGLILADSYNN